MGAILDDTTEDSDAILCGRCKCPMVQLARYDVMNEISGVEGPITGEDLLGIEWIFLRWFIIVPQAAWYWVVLKFKSWRLKRVLRQYPRTLICPNCGVLLKR